MPVCLCVPCWRLLKLAGVLLSTLRSLPKLTWRALNKPDRTRKPGGLGRPRHRVCRSCRRGHVGTSTCRFRTYSTDAGSRASLGRNDCRTLVRRRGRRICDPDLTCRSCTYQEDTWGHQAAITCKHGPWPRFKAHNSPGAQGPDRRLVASRTCCRRGALGQQAGTYAAWHGTALYVNEQGTGVPALGRQLDGPVPSQIQPRHRWRRHLSWVLCRIHDALLLLKPTRFHTHYTCSVLSGGSWVLIRQVCLPLVRGPACPCQGQMGAALISAPEKKRGVVSARSPEEDKARHEVPEIAHGTVLPVPCSLSVMRSPRGRGGLSVKYLLYKFCRSPSA